MSFRGATVGSLRGAGRRNPVAALGGLRMQSNYFDGLDEPEDEEEVSLQVSFHCARFRLISLLW